MQHVQIEVHHGICEVISLDPDVEIELVDVDGKAVVRYSREGDKIAWHVLTDEEIASHE